MSDSAAAYADLRNRVVWGGALAAVALAAVLIGGWWMALAVAAMTAIVAAEWSGITLGRDLGRGPWLAGPAILAVLVAASDQPLAAVIVAVVGAVAVGVWLRTGWATLGILYASALGVSLVLLRADPLHGLAAVIFLLLVVWGSDIGAYFAGRTFGGPKLWPRISPKKTWSGFVGGTLIGSVAGIVSALIAGAGLSAALVLVAVALSVISAAGDLFESGIKRRFNTKDASNLIPGHGGMMDRVDGLLFASAAAALIGWLHLGWPFLGAGLLWW